MDRLRNGSHVLPARALNIHDLVSLSRNEGVGLVNSNRKGRRANKRARRQKMLNATLLAPLLAAEGCLNLGKRDLNLGGEEERSLGGGNAGKGQSPASGANPNPKTQPEPAIALDAQDDHFNTAPGEPIFMAASQLQANDIHDNSGPLEIVRVFDAVNGKVFIDGAIVQFVPDEGFQGTASFRYEIRDASGAISEAVVEIHVGEHDHDKHHHGGGSGGHEGHDPHPDDPSKSSEHMALMDLVPVAEASHVAVKNGSWFDPNTWANGEVPGEGAKVVIPEGVTVLYDGESPASLFTVRVDGALEFATDKDTFMEVDTMVVTKTGSLTIGTIDHPVQDGVQSVIQIADNGPIDTAWDTHLLSRGVISHGAVEIHGGKKDSFLKVAVDPMAGDRSLTLEAPPAGWEVGDRLVLTGTHLQDVDWRPAGEKQPDVDTEDEEIIITAIEGNVIHFDRALKYDHDTPRDDLKAYVANYSRNIKILTENADDLPVSQRGHVMFMHSNDIDVRYAEFTDLGRTDKSERAFDVSDLSAVESDSNVKGRYSLHIHRAGVAEQDDPAMLVGNAVWGSPGWGVVHHDSHAVLADNAAYDIFGAAFVSETGNETGRWSHNIAIKSIGVRGIGHDNNPKVGADVEAFDLGRTGAGFWFQSRMVDSVDNVAAGVPSGHGFVYFSRIPKADEIKLISDYAAQPESLNYDSTARLYEPAIATFSGNEALASGSGFYVVKPGPNQRHDVRSVIEDFTAWETRFGMHIEYTGHYTFLNVDLIGAANGQWGISTGQNTIDFAVNGAKIDGFEVGVYMSKTHNFKEFDGDFRYAFIDVDISGAVRDYENLDGSELFLTASDLIAGRLDFLSNMGAFPLFKIPDGESYMNFTGTKTDSIGDYEIGKLDPHLYGGEAVPGAIQREGYWTLPDGRAVTVFERYFADRATGELMKTATFVEIHDLERTLRFVEGEPVYHGVLDLSNDAPVANDDIATVKSGGSVLIDVLGNDFDPDGDPLAVDGFVHPEHGDLTLNENGAVTYTPDPNYVGEDLFYYWVEDDNGNLTKAAVTVTVEA